MCHLPAWIHFLGVSGHNQKEKADKKISASSSLDPPATSEFKCIADPFYTALYFCVPGQIKREAAFESLIEY